MSRRGLQAVLAAIGGVAVVAGLRDALGGAKRVVDGGPVSANVDSEFRFYSTWYAVLGVLVLRAARRPEAETVAVQACGAGFGLAAVSRLLSRRSHGEPHGFLKALTVVEFLIPATIIPWQRALKR